ncbi:NADPH-dependent FMN reductase [Chromatiales bacterium (ex Bugula neritina AB1)]|nr:NADPH-dependent FMN reductase [Chromatiales bacterium (ex Bugula neritina AB1)]
MGTAKILAFAGSTRKGSFNDKLLTFATKIARDAGAEVTHISLADYDMPLLSQDWEAEHGLPEAAKRLKDLFLAHNGLLLACPEYNGSLTPLLKNAIDWVSRPASKEETPLSCYVGKTAGLISASPGALGGLRGLRHVREVLSNIQVLVTPAQFALSTAHSAFDEERNLVDEKQTGRLKSVVDQLVRVCGNQG